MLQHFTCLLRDRLLHLCTAAHSDVDRPHNHRHHFAHSEDLVGQPEAVHHVLEVVQAGHLASAADRQAGVVHASALELRFTPANM